MNIYSPQATPTSCWCVHLFFPHGEKSHCPRSSSVPQHRRLSIQIGPLPFIWKWSPIYTNGCLQTKNSIHERDTLLNHYLGFIYSQSKINRLNSVTVILHYVCMYLSKAISLVCQNCCIVLVWSAIIIKLYQFWSNCVIEYGQKKYNGGQES